MREATIQAQLAAVRAEFARVEAEYRVLLDLTANYERWLAIIAGHDPSATGADETGDREPPRDAASATGEAAADQDDGERVTTDSHGDGSEAHDEAQIGSAVDVNSEARPGGNVNRG